MQYRWMMLACLVMIGAGFSRQAIAQNLPQVSAGSIHRLADFPSVWVPKRHVDVWVPSGFPANQRYAVLYMQDGQMLFDRKQTWNQQEWQVDEVAQRLMLAGKVQPFIVVAVFNGDANRHAEYFPQKPFLQLPPRTQQQYYQLRRDKDHPLFSRPIYSDQYLQFLVTELKPYIDEHFPVYTDRAHTFIMGSSMGGLISMYALSEYPNVFGGAACLSTHWPGIFTQQQNPVPELFLAYMRTHLPPANSRKLYFDYGDQTLDAWYPPLQQQADSLLAELGWTAPMWRSQFFKGAAHSETDWAKRLDVPLQFLLGPTP